jgi:hypothetical protein
MSAKKAFLILSLIILIVGICTTAEAKAVTQKQAGDNKIVLEYEFREPIVSSGGEYDSVRMDETQAYERTGAPIIPVQPVRILIPFGKKVVTSRVTALDTQQMPGTYRLAVAQEPYPLSYKGPIKRTEPDPAIYGQAKPWPRTDHQELGTQSKRGYQIFTVNLFPLQYTPTTGQISYTTRLRLEIDLADSVMSNVLRPSEKVKSKLNKMVDNPGAAMETYPSQGGSVQRLGGVAATLPSGGPYQYVIITNAALEASPGPWNFQALRDAKIAKGMTATIVTTEWIYANYAGTKPSGGSDNQTQIRNFLIDAYQNWGTQYVLLGGTNAIVPARLFWVDSLAWRKDYMPVDMYYGCVEPSTCTFDYDADNKYGEPTDGVGGGDVDLYAEIYVGRAPVENAAELQCFVRKTLEYSSTQNEYLPRIAMLGEYLGFGGVSEYATEMMEQIRLGGNYDNYFTYGFENHIQPYFIDFNTQGVLPADCCWPLYDAPGYSWSKEELICLMNGGVHIFNHLGHANYTYDMKLNTSDLGSLTNTDYFFVYSQGCEPGWFDLPDCFAEVLTSMEHGAFAVIMNARYGWGTPYSTNGPSQRYNRQFWDAVLGDGILEIGRANQDSKEHWVPNISGACMRWCYYELNLFGDPSQQFRLGPSFMLSNIDDVNDGDCREPGDEIMYTICYSYLGDYPDINDVNIIDYLPDEVEYVSSEPGPNEILDSNTIIWKIGTLKSGDANCIKLKVRVKYRPSGTIRNKCELIRSGDQTLKTVYEYTPVCCRRVYVDVNAPGSNNGTSWENAYKNLQDALKDANISPCCGEIWVSAGTYRPDSNSADPNGSGDRNATFSLINNVAIYGGFPPGGGSWKTRNLNSIRNKTILNGDLKGNDTYSSNPGDPCRVDNSYHVVTANSINATAVLDGFTITGGNANGSTDSQKRGGGMYTKSGSPTVTNCIFSRNSALIDGGGIYNSNCNSTIINCTFSSNSATYGGGMDNYHYSSPMITNCTFIGNSATYGGGMDNNSFSSPIVTNCTFSSNVADINGGGMCNEYYCNPMITNCILWGNTAPTGPQIYNNLLSSPTITYSDIEGGWTGTGNINAYPCFIRPYMTPAYRGDYRLGTRRSPCIDAGDNNSVPPDYTDLDGDGNTTEPIPFDLTGRQRTRDGDCDGRVVVDMGAYESYLIGDLNNNCYVNLIDYAIFMWRWRPNTNESLETDCDASNNWCDGVDFTRDGRINWDDFYEFLIGYRDWTSRR